MNNKLELFAKHRNTLSDLRPIQKHIGIGGKPFYIATTNTGELLRLYDNENSTSPEKVMGMWGHGFGNEQEILECIIDFYKDDKPFNTKYFQDALDFAHICVKKAYELPTELFKTITSLTNLQVFDEDLICFNIIGKSKNILIDLTHPQALEKVLLPDNESTLTTLLSWAQKYKYVIIDMTKYRYQANFSIDLPKFSTKEANELMSNKELIFYKGKEFDLKTTLRCTFHSDSEGVIDLESDSELSIKDLDMIKAHILRTDLLKEFTQTTTHYGMFIQICD